MSVTQKNEVRQILDSVGESDRFEVHQVSFDDFSSVDWRLLSNYKGVVFGVSDGYYGHFQGLSAPAVGALARFVTEGGGLLWTHDTLADLRDLAEISGFRNGSGSDRVPMTVDSVRILRTDHPVLRWPYQTGLQSRILQKGAHSTGTYSHPPVALEAASAQILIDHNIQPSGPHNYYLTVHTHGSGRVALFEVGHAETERLALFEAVAGQRLVLGVCHGGSRSSCRSKEAASRLYDAFHGAPHTVSESEHVYCCAVAALY